MDNNQFSVLLSGMIDEAKSVSNINTQIKNIQKSLKEVNISLNLGNVDKQLNSLMDKINNTTKMGNKNPMSAYQKALEDTIHKYKTGLVDLETYSKRMQSIIFGNASTYKGDFMKLSDRSQEKYVNELNKAYQLQGRALDEVYKTTKKIQSEDDKRLKAINDQSIAIQKMRVAFENANLKYDTGVNQDKSNGIQAQIDALARLNPQSAEYARILKETQMAVGLYNKELITTTTSENKQSKAIVDKTIAISKLKDKLNSMNANYGSYVDSGKSSEITRMIGDLEKLSPLSVEYSNKLKTIQYETSKLGSQSKQSFKLAQDAISDTTSKTTAMGLALRQVMAVFAVGSPIFMARNVFMDMTTSINEMNKAMTDIRVVTDMSAESANGLNKTYNQLAIQMGATTMDVLQGSTEWFRQGKTIAETQELVKSSIIGSKLAGIEAADMTQYLTSALNGYKMEASSAISVIDKLVAVDNAAATSVSELAIAMSHTASSARMVGVDMDDLIGYIGTVSSVTRKSAESIGNSFKTIFSRFQNLKLGNFIEDGMVMSDVRKALGNVKIDIMETEDTFRDFGVVLDELSGKWGTLSDAEKSSVAGAMAGIRQREDFIVLLDNISMSADLTTKSIESQGLSMERYDIYLQSTEAALNRFKASAEALYIETLGSETINGIVNLGVAMLDMATKAGGLGTILKGVGLSFIALKAASLFIVEDGVIVGISSITKALFTLKGTTDIATASTLALSAAQKTLIVGAVITGVMAIGAAINHISKSAERAQQKIQTLKTELSDLDTEVQNSNADVNKIEDLSKQYEELVELREAQWLSNEEQEKFTRIQNEIKEIMPEVNGFFDSQGNFILDQTVSMKSLNDQMAELNENFRIQRAEKAQDLSGELLKKQEEEKKNLAELIEYRNLYNQSLDVKWGTEAWDKLDKQMKAMIKESPGLIHDIKGVENLDSAIENLKATYEETAKSIDSSVLDMMAGTKEWTALTVQQQDAIRRILSEFSQDDNQYLARSFENGSLAVGEYVEYLRDGEKAQRYMQEAIDDTNASVMFQRKTLAEINDIVADTTKTYKESSSEIEKLEKAMDELNEIHDLTNETRDAMIDKYPELLGLIGDEAAQRQFLSGKIEEQEEIHRQALLNMLEYDDEFYRNRILGSEETAEAIRVFYQEMVDGLGLDYQIDLDNFTTLAELKEEVAAQSASNIQSLWSQLSYNGMAMGPMSHAPNFSLDDILPNNNFAPKGISKRSISSKKTGGSGSKKSSSEKEDYIKYVTEGFDDAIKEIESKSDELERAINRANNKIETANIMGDTKGELALQEELKTLYDKRIKIEEEKSIALLNLRKKLTTELSKKGYSELKDVNLEAITEKQLSDVNRNIDKEIDKANKSNNEKLKADLEYRKAMINEYVSAIIDTNKNVNEISVSIIADKNAYMEQTIAILERQYELEDKLLNNRVRDIEVQMMLVKDGSEAHLALEQQKYDELINKQTNHLNQIKKLREAGLEVDQEQIDKYINMWYQAETERINMIKSMGEQAKKLRLDALNSEQKELGDAQKATQNLVDMVMKMLKQQYADEKALIQENSKIKEDAHKKEVDGYKKIIEERKKSLREEKDNKDYDKELKAKQDKVKNVSNKILALENDTSKKAQADRLKLEEEKLQLIDELNEFQENRSIEQQEKALDEELKRYEESKNKELEKYKKEKDEELKKLDEHLSKEGNLRAEAIRLIESKNRELYDKLIEWNKDYGSGIRGDVSDAWYDAYEAMSNYNDGQLDVLETLSQISDKLREVKINIEDVNNSSWQDYVNEDDIKSGGSKFPIYETDSSKPNNNSNNGKKYTEQEAKELIQKNQQKYLHNEAKKAKAEGRAGAIAWVESERKLWGLDPTSGEIKTPGKVPNDVWERDKKKYGFMKGGTTSATGFHWLDGTPNSPEMVLSGVQTKSFTQLVEYLPNVISKIVDFERIDGNTSGDITLKFDNMINVEGNLDSDVDIDEIIEKAKKATIDAINKTLFNKGIRRRVTDLNK